MSGSLYHTSNSSKQQETSIFICLIIVFRKQTINWGVTDRIVTVLECVCASDLHISWWVVQLLYWTLIWCCLDNLFTGSPLYWGLMNRLNCGWWMVKCVWVCVLRGLLAWGVSYIQISLFQTLFSTKVAHWAVVNHITRTPPRHICRDEPVPLALLSVSCMTHTLRRDAFTGKCSRGVSCTSPPPSPTLLPLLQSKRRDFPSLCAFPHLWVTTKSNGWVYLDLYVLLGFRFQMHVCISLSLSLCLCVCVWLRLCAAFRWKCRSFKMQPVVLEQKRNKQGLSLFSPGQNQSRSSHQVDSTVGELLRTMNCELSGVQLEFTKQLPGRMGAH